MKKPSTLTLFSSLICIVILFLSSFSTSNKHYYGEDLSSTHLKSFKDGNVTINTLKESYSDVGHSIWLKRGGTKEAKAVYFSEGDVYGKLNKWKRGKELVLTCSGAFSDDLYKTNGALPVGLNVENGYIKNRTVVKEGMDGLVIVYATGGIVVSDLTKGDLFLQSLGKKVNVRKDVSAKYDLLKWAEDEKATIFQTQLLAYDNQLKIGYEGRKQKRERRFLSLAKTSSGTLYHIIFNFPSGEYLYDGAKKVMEHLNDKGMNVIALLNLDTGAYNVMDLNTGDYSIDSSVKGSTRVSDAVNLLSYHYD
jgi:hypothetical protein